MRVKGSLILDYVRIIRANKDRDWTPHLDETDLDIVNGKVLASNWYPYDSFKRIALAIYKEMANSDPEVARGFGRYTIDNFVNIYKNILMEGDPAGTLKKLITQKRLYFDGDTEIEVKEAGKNFVKYRVKAPTEEAGSEHFKAFSYTLAGNAEQLAAKAGGKNVSTEIDYRDESFEIKISWE